MDWLRIRNAGEMDPNALFLLGASSKRGDNSKIGFFGSGAKYALAVLLREDVAVRVFSGEREIPITLEGVDFRGQGFRRIVIDGQPTSFTTNMGPTWEPWFALRELICNAIDEGEADLVEIDDKDMELPCSGLAGEVDKTTFLIDLDHPGLRDFVDNMDDYLIEPGAESIYGAMIADYPKGIEVHIHEASQEGRHFMYRRGVLVTEHGNMMKGLYRYDFSDATINESRIASYPWQLNALASMVLCTCDDDAIVARVYNAIRSGEDVWESDMTFPVGLSESWYRAVVAASGEGAQIIPSTLVGYLPHEDTIGAVVLPERPYQALLEAFRGRLCFRSESTAYLECSSDDASRAIERIERVSEGLKEVGIELAVGYRIVVVDIKADRVVAATHTEEKRIVISRKHAEEADDIDFEATLAEEFMHSHGHGDGSRAFEDWLIKGLIAARREGREARRKVEAIRNII